MVTSGSLRADSRRTAILDALAAAGTVDLEAMAQTLGVSTMTIRRDLDELERAGVVRRVRGGAVAVSELRPFRERRATHRREKQQIAAKAAALVPESGVIALDGSSTVAALAARIDARRDLTVATNSYETFLALPAGGAVQPVLVGGVAEPTTGSFVGPIACQAAGALVYRRLFVSAIALDPRLGTSEASLEESQVKRAFGANAASIVLCLDSSKLGESSRAAGFALAQITTLITELDPADARLDPYRDEVELL